MAYVFQFPGDDKPTFFGPGTQQEGTFKTEEGHLATTFDTIAVKPENCDGLPEKFSTDWSGWITLKNMKTEKLNGKQARYVGFDSVSGRAHVRVFDTLILGGAGDFSAFFK